MFIGCLTASDFRLAVICRHLTLIWQSSAFCQPLTASEKVVVVEPFLLSVFADYPEYVLAVLLHALLAEMRDA